ncbi:hypothetical protein Pst134EA_017188 [Puccinia striiformis f. sp. tritici]|uniref:hypothetical protein n=1 Tax=Puccinia striiformis f. sp. tritici TaxID=168172 RepID=UPI0020077955|nr:hypothetical protein Pst134EA_017188 [Puccinia striiformis f. sp. tritici]KAH9460877.1 hypothetical protein Pst134EA_017188 [Puccinia striiformis f. sp. tritici]
MYGQAENVENSTQLDPPQEALDAKHIHAEVPKSLLLQDSATDGDEVELDSPVQESDEERAPEIHLEQPEQSLVIDPSAESLAEQTSAASDEATAPSQEVIDAEEIKDEALSDQVTPQPGDIVESYPPINENAENRAHGILPDEPEQSLATEPSAESPTHQPSVTINDQTDAPQESLDAEATLAEVSNLPARQNPAQPGDVVELDSSTNENTVEDLGQIDPAPIENSLVQVSDAGSPTNEHHTDPDAVTTATIDPSTTQSEDSVEPDLLVINDADDDNIPVVYTPKSEGQVMIENSVSIADGQSHESLDRVVDTEETIAQPHLAAEAAAIYTDDVAPPPAVCQIKGESSTSDIDVVIDGENYSREAPGLSSEHSSGQVNETAISDESHEIQNARTDPSQIPLENAESRALPTHPIIEESCAVASDHLEESPAHIPVETLPGEQNPAHLGDVIVSALPSNTNAEDPAPQIALEQPEHTDTLVDESSILANVVEFDSSSNENAEEQAPETDFEQSGQSLAIEPSAESLAEQTSAASDEARAPSQEVIDAEEIKNEASSDQVTPQPGDVVESHPPINENAENRAHGILPDEPEQPLATEPSAESLTHQLSATFNDNPVASQESLDAEATLAEVSDLPARQNPVQPGDVVELDSSTNEDAEGQEIVSEPPERSDVQPVNDEVSNLPVDQNSGRPGDEVEMDLPIIEDSAERALEKVAEQPDPSLANELSAPIPAEQTSAISDATPPQQEVLDAEQIRAEDPKSLALQESTPDGDEVELDSPVRENAEELSPEIQLVVDPSAKSLDEQTSAPFNDASAASQDTPTTEAIQTDLSDLTLDHNSAEPGQVVESVSPINEKAEGQVPEMVSEQPEKSPAIEPSAGSLAEQTSVASDEATAASQGTLDAEEAILTSAGEGATPTVTTSSAGEHDDSPPQTSLTATEQPSNVIAANSDPETTPVMDIDSATDSAQKLAESHTPINLLKTALVNASGPKKPVLALKNIHDSYLPSFLDSPPPSSTSVPKPPINPATAKVWPATPAVSNIQREIILPARMQRISAISTSSAHTLFMKDLATFTFSPSHPQIPKPPPGIDSTNTNPVVPRQSPPSTPPRVAKPDCEYTSSSPSNRAKSMSNRHKLVKPYPSLKRTRATASPDRRNRRSSYRSVTFRDKDDSPTNGGTRVVDRNRSMKLSEFGLRSKLSKRRSGRLEQNNDLADAFAIIEVSDALPYSPRADRYINPTLSRRLSSSVKDILQKRQNRDNLSRSPLGDVYMAEDFHFDVEKELANLPGSSPEDAFQAAEIRTPGPSVEGENDNRPDSQNVRNSVESKGSSKESFLSNDPKGKKSRRVRSRLAEATLSITDKIVRN